jgi:hypothetical protein
MESTLTPEPISGDTVKSDVLLAQTSSQHAPGPWGSIERSAKEIRLKRRHWEVGSMVTRKGVAYVFGDDNSNARLVASAPDLLAALKEALCFVEAYRALSEAGDIMREETERRVRSAIAKAEGSPAGSGERP